MAQKINFVSKHTDHTGQQWTLMVVNRSGDVPAWSAGNVSENQLDLLAPGVAIQYEGDEFRFSKTTMGSSLTFSAKLTCNQVDKWDSLLGLVEGDVCCLFFKGHQPSPFNCHWYGHLVPESGSFDISDNNLSVTFTDGLAHLSYVDFKQNNGNPYTNTMNLTEILVECFNKIPGRDAFHYWSFNDYTGSVSTIDILTEAGLPRNAYFASEGDPILEPDFEFGSVLRACSVDVRTFVKKKKLKDRTREVRTKEYDPTFVDCYSIIEDVAKSFGCSYYLWSGSYHITNRIRLYQLDGSSELKCAVHKVSSTYTIAHDDADNALSDYNLDLDDGLYIKSGATFGRTLPYSDVVFTHETAGDDALYLEGVPRFLNEAYWAVNQQNNTVYHPATGQVSMDPVVANQYKAVTRWNHSYDLAQTTVEHISDASSAQLDPSGGHVTDRYGQIGFPTRYYQDLAIEPASEMRMTFGGLVHFLADGDFRSHVGAHAVLKMRLELEDSNGTFWRLSRKVITHVFSSGSQDGINLNLWDVSNPSSFIVSDVNFFRKLYGTLEWLNDSDPDYGDAFYEVLVPHGDSTIDEGQYSSELTGLVVDYAGQTPYVGAMAKVDGENDDAVELKYDFRNRNVYHYFREDIQLTFPETSATNIDTIEVWWQLEIYAADAGPNPNGAYDRDSPMFRTNSASGSTQNNDGYVAVSVPPTYTYGWPVNYPSLGIPKEFSLSGAKIVLGNGENDSDRVIRIAGGLGNETYDMGSSRFGSYSNYLQPLGTGKLNCKLIYSGAYSPNADFSTGGVTSYPYDANDWFPYKNTIGGTSLVDNAYDSLHKLVIGEYLSVFGRSQKTFNGTILGKYENGRSPVSDLICPHNIISTTNLDRIADVRIMPLSISWDMMGGSKISGLVTGASRTPNLEITEVFEGRNPGSSVTDPGGVPPPVAIAKNKLAASKNEANITVIDGKFTDLNTAKDDLEAQSFFLER